MKHSPEPESGGWYGKRALQDKHSSSGSNRTNFVMDNEINTLFKKSVNSCCGLFLPTKPKILMEQKLIL